MELLASLGTPSPFDVGEEKKAQKSLALRQASSTHLSSNARFRDTMSTSRLDQFVNTCISTQLCQLTSRYSCDLRIMHVTRTLRSTFGPGVQGHANTRPLL